MLRAALTLRDSAVDHSEFGKQVSSVVRHEHSDGQLFVAAGENLVGAQWVVFALVEYRVA